MESPNPLAKLRIDYWYHAVMVVFATVFLLCGMGLLKTFPTAPTAAISAGGFFIGLGEWVNHPLQTKLMQFSNLYPTGVVTSHPRNNRLIGVAFVTLGCTLIGYGLLILFR